MVSPGISCWLGGPINGGLGTKVDRSGTASSSVRSSTYFFFKVFSFWWQIGRGASDERLWETWLRVGGMFIGLRWI